MYTIDDWQLNELDRRAIDNALREDLGWPYKDLTTDLLFPSTEEKKQAIILAKAKEPIILCGLKIIPALFESLGSSCTITAKYKDGDIVSEGDIVLTLCACPHDLLVLERILLNFLRHLSGIATLTNKFAQAIKHTKTKILDTRKTTPGLRHLEKYAVFCGGGVNHRLGLYDAYMIKDTHLDLYGGNLAAIIAKLPEKPKYPVIIEVRSEQELETVIRCGKNKVTRVLLDNMPLDLLKKCVLRAKDFFETEASGNINLLTISQIAATEVDYASVGMLTYSAGHVDLSMQAL